MAGHPVELRFPPVPGHVRTARLVAAVVARRSRLDDARLDEVRLAVGEACARAVRRSQDSGTPEPITLRIHDAGPSFTVEIIDAATEPDDDEPVVLALLRGLADVVELAPGPKGPGGTLGLTWHRTPPRQDPAL